MGAEGSVGTWLYVGRVASRRSVVYVAGAVLFVVLSTRSSAWAMASADWKRSEGAFCNAWAVICARGCGMLGLSSCTDGAGVCTCWYIRPIVVVERKGTRPVKSWKSTTPSA